MEAEVPTIPDEALQALPIFPLPDTVLLPRTFVSLHVFEPRYRRMLEDISDGHRLLAIGMLDDEGKPDRFGRPPIHRVAGVGFLRRSARLPDGRYNLVLEGVLRADISDELGPDLPYRRARARLLFDVMPDDPRTIESTIASVRGLYARVIGHVQGIDPELLARLNELRDPGTLADMIAAAALPETEDRQRILAETNIARRLDHAAAALGALLLRSEEKDKTPQASIGWGIGTGKA